MKQRVSSVGCQVWSGEGRRPSDACRVSNARRLGPRPSTFDPRLSHGVALVITLVLLSVITFMAVTFLLISHSERGQVSTETDQTIARIASDAALERAKIDLIARMLAFTNAYSFPMLVSTCYVNSAGFQPGVSSPLNVSYTYANGQP